MKHSHLPRRGAAAQHAGPHGASHGCPWAHSAHRHIPQGFVSFPFGSLITLGV
jgi:hypothetical protein